ncbi:hypothetical protein BBJ29_006690 [Phytophthora kernoviae]|uniref:PX domain-containing protein n=1 Tax=Phytophthora kernoviae TaxID=325452 RepID=A0A3F2RFP5_9STRA|nr:hypothetical protein BBP00_00008346 [Phytophthora kernoviae]RLN71703.1 hypothetical protein BBJ29_006690 [Phytophthora kernoviae]
MDSVPLFEREHRNDSQLVQRLQNELSDAKRFVEAQARRQNDLEYVNEDLERRLEQEALDRITLDAQKSEDEKRWQQEKEVLHGQLKSWEQRFEEETRRRSMAEERLRRAEKELYRMHQKKYDIEKQVRREEIEKRKHEAQIVRSLQSDSQRAQQNAANGFLDPTLNPKDAKPAAVRTRQALSSAMDFLGRQDKVATSNDARRLEISSSAAVLGGCMPESHYLNGQDKMVQFAGLYVVRGPTESKHVRYTMDVAVVELQLRGRCIQRFQSFFMLRKRLLEGLKSCRGRLPARKSTLCGDDDAPQVSVGMEVVDLLTRPRCIQCSECESTSNQLAAVKFPRRTLFTPNFQDIQERSQMLETFLDYCVRLATAWPACQRSKRLFVNALGKFLCVDLAAYLANQKEDGDSTVARTDAEEELEQPERTPSSSEVPYMPSPQECDDKLHSLDDFEDRQSEPNFSFITIPSTSGYSEAEGVMARSQSHN